MISDSRYFGLRCLLQGLMPQTGACIKLQLFNRVVAESDLSSKGGLYTAVLYEVNLHKN